VFVVRRLLAQTTGETAGRAKTKMKEAAKETVYRISIAIWVSVVRADNPNFNQWSSGRCSAFGKKPLALTAGPT